MIGAAFERARAAGEAALVAYLTAGDPDLRRSLERLDALDRAGADVVEIGVPFSDPVADGPTIQSASRRALAAGFTLRGLLAALSARAGRAPRVLMSYLNPLLSLGDPDDVARAAAAAGIAGLLVPDLPLEESFPWREAARRHGLDLPLLVAPTTPTDRIAPIAHASSGFVYVVAVAGTTGARATLPAGLAATIERVRALSPLPVAVGFGVSTQEQVAAVGAHADGVVVGSRLVDAAARGEDLEALVRGLKRATRRMPCSSS